MHAVLLWKLHHFTSWWNPVVRNMRMVNTMVITLNIWMAIRKLSETDDSGINSDALLLVVMALL